MRKSFLASAGVIVVAASAWGAIALAQSEARSTPRPPQGYLAPGTLDEKIFLPPPDARSPSPARLTSRSFAQPARFATRPAGRSRPRTTRRTRAACSATSAARLARLKPAEAPVLSRLLQRAIADAGPLIGPPKDRYARPRPFLKAKGPVCISLSPEFSKSGSYPSGHSTVGWLYALVLAEASPDRASALLARGRAFGESRVVCGVHYASDVEAGYLVASSVTATLNSNPAFRDDLAAARTELEQVRQRATAPDAAQCTSEQMTLSRRPW